MIHLRVNDYDMAYIEVGGGPPLVCVHGSLCDFRVWSPVLGPLSCRHRVIAPSLRRFFPEHWDGTGGGFTIAQHAADLIAFIEGVGAGPVHLLGHSRGGHLAFRVAQQRPDLLRKLILAEPGGDLDASLALTDASVPSRPPLRAHVAAAAEKIASGDIDGGLAYFGMRSRVRERGCGSPQRQGRGCATTHSHSSVKSMRRASPTRAPMRNRSACRHCSSAGRTQAARCRESCVRWPHMFRAHASQ